MAMAMAAVLSFSVAMAAVLFVPSFFLWLCVRGLRCGLEADVTMVTDFPIFYL